MPAAARKGDAGIPHCGPYVIATASSDVIINGRGAARVGDVATPHLRPAGRRCGVHAPPIIRGSASVIINGRQAALLGDALSSCTLVASGSSDVIIGG